MAPHKHDRHQTYLLVGDFAGLDAKLMSTLEELGYPTCQHFAGYARLESFLPQVPVAFMLCRMQMHDDSTALDMVEHLKSRDIATPPVLLLSAHAEEFASLHSVKAGCMARGWGPFPLLVPPPWADAENLRTAIAHGFRKGPLPPQFLKPAASAH